MRKNKQTVASNKKAFFDYKLGQKFVAGIVLKGEEIKGIRRGKVQLTGSYIRLFSRKGSNLPEAYWIGGLISSTSESGSGYEKQRTRKLLLTKQELKRLTGRVSQGGQTLVPLRIFFRKGLAKLEIALAKGKTKHDKRQALREKAIIRSLRSR